MRGQIEIADDLGPEQAHDVREHRELEAGDDLLGDRGPTDEGASLEHDDFLAGAREIGGGNETVVSPADDDGVVTRGGHARFRAGS